MKILVIGATGALGRPVVQQLCARGVVVRALSRHPERGSDLAALGAETVAGDLAEPDSLVRACDGVDRVFAAAHSMLGRGRYRSQNIDDIGHRALIAAARDAGVKRFVYISGYGVAPNHPVDFFRTKHAIEEVLAGSGLDAVVLRPTCFMEQHVHLFNGKQVLDKGRARLIGPGTKARNFVCAADLARLAVRALLEDPPPFRLLAVGGPGHYSNNDVADLYARTAGFEPRVSHLPRAIAALMAVLARPLHPGFARILRIASLPDDAFSERFESSVDFERDFGVRMTPVEEFIRRQVEAAGISSRPR
jgi:uncharacterized protein YbjT (DUF2867 family)